MKDYANLVLSPETETFKIVGMPQNHISKPARAAFVTALGLEFLAVEAHLSDLREERHPRGSVYKIGHFHGQAGWDVAVVETGMHNVNAGMETERLIAHFEPEIVFFVGVAGGLKDVALGDVVAATKISAYEAGKVEVEFKPRPEIGESSYDLVQRARSVRREKYWQNRIKGEFSGSPNAYVEPIVAGSKVVADIDSVTYKLIRQFYSDAVAIEMEGYGFLRAAYINRQVQALAVRGISDLVEHKGEADSSGSQPRAAANAAAFAFEVLSHIEPRDSLLSTTGGKQIDHEWFSRLEALAASLYPSGPMERQLWSRAGGDVALLEQERTGVAAWHTACRGLEQGGGGSKITVKTLIPAMQQDYSANSELAALAERLDR